MRCISPTVAGVCAAILVLVAGSAGAADHGITGKKLLLKPSKFAVVSRDADARASASPVCPAADSSLTFSDGVHTRTFALPCANWSDRGTTFKYRDTSAYTGPSHVDVARSGAGRLKLVGRGLGGFPIPNGPASIDVILRLGATIERYCTAFTGTGNGNTVVIRDAPAGSCPVCGDNTIEPSETCDGSADADCPGECRPDCTCPAPICGNNMREGAEACDGGDATACPGHCLADCTCVSACSGAPGDATACLAFGTQPQCTACCADEECFICVHAFDSGGCSDPALNDYCSLALTVVGCATECCSPP